MGEAYYVLGIKITRDRKNKKLSLSQRPYLKNVRKKFKMNTCKVIESSIHYNKDDFCSVFKTMQKGVYVAFKKRKK